MKLMRKNGGFTLVELIVVIAILAILAGIAVPAYSGYIQKAEKAADMQLLGAVNESFQAACVAEGTTAAKISSASLKWDGAKVVGIASVKGADPAAIDAAFKMFYAGNEGTEFKVLANKLVFANGVFAEMGSAMSKVMDALRNDATLAGAIQAVKNSAFNTIGYDVLAEQIDNASGMIAELAGNESSGFYDLIMGTANEDVFYEYVGDNVDAVVAAKKEQLKAQYPDMDDVALEDMAINQLYTNTAILTAAKKSSAVNNDFISSLSNGSAVDALKASTDGGEATEETIAQAAFAYAMYTSYKASKGEDVSGEVNLLDVYDVLGSEDFRTNYMSSDQFTADKEGYLGAMNLVTSGASSADGDLANDILINGFNSGELVALIQGVTN